MVGGCGGTATGIGRTALGGGCGGAATGIGNKVGCGPMGHRFGVLVVAFGGVSVDFGCRCGHVTLASCGQVGDTMSPVEG